MSNPSNNLEIVRSYLKATTSRISQGLTTPLRHYLPTDKILR